MALWGGVIMWLAQPDRGVWNALINAYGLGSLSVSIVVWSSQNKTQHGDAGFQDEWRHLPELNWCTRFCRPLRNHSAKVPCVFILPYERIFWKKWSSRRCLQRFSMAIVAAIGCWLTTMIIVAIGHCDHRLPPHSVILCYNNSGRPDGGIGIRVRLKIEWSNPYGFKSHSGHHFFVTNGLESLFDVGEEIVEVLAQHGVKARFELLGFNYVILGIFPGAPTRD